MACVVAAGLLVERLLVRSTVRFWKLGRLRGSVAP
jgi:hypothetical protein